MKCIVIKQLAATGIVLMLGACSNPLVRDKRDYDPVYPVLPQAGQTSDGAIYSASSGFALFEDIKARRVGDVLTVLLVERTDAKKSASTSTSRDTEVGVAEPTVFGRPVTRNGVPILGAELQANSAFDGSGDSNQSNELSGSITVSVAEVLSNGYLVVRGEKQLGINQGSELIRLSGIVRPVDIRPDNTVASTQLANARIDYRGKGTLNDSNRPGWLTRFFQSPIWPF